MSQFGKKEKKRAYLDRLWNDLSRNVGPPPIKYSLEVSQKFGFNLFIY